MAIIKALELDNGITVSYHRISVIRSIVNNHINIEVLSYINKSKREKEKKEIMDKATRTAFTYIQFFILDFDPNFTLTDAYNYIKSLDQFKGGEDDTGE